VLVACPYITLEYLEPVLGSASSWRLLTDVEAWLGNYGTNERNTIREFIAHYHDRIHDVRNLHAKAVVGETGALVGSANLTWTGLQGRDELGVRLNELK
jgi:phosphatidylserine/phosphatidylglycerophosphate/cardiolipin synthase-like enzyme